MAVSGLDVPSDRFGWFYNMNGTSWADGLLRMKTGAGQLAELGEIVSWNGETVTHYQGDCGAVRGSADGLLPPGSLNSNFSIWSTDTCRSAPHRTFRQGQIYISDSY